MPIQRQQRCHCCDGIVHRWSCSVCRKEHTGPVYNYPRNYFIERLVDKFKSEQLKLQQQQLEKQKEEQLRQEFNQQNEKFLRDELRDQHLKQLEEKQQKQQKEEQLQQQLKQHQLNELDEQRLVIRQLIDQQWKIEEKKTTNNEEIVHEFREQGLKKLRKQQQKENELKRTLEKKRLFLEQQKATKYNEQLRKSS